MNKKGETMKVDVTEKGVIRLKDVFNTVLFETDEGEKLAVCMRDGGFEVGIKSMAAKSPDETEFFSWYRAIHGQIKRMAFTAKNES